MTEAQTGEIITKEFLETVLRGKIENFTVSNGSKAGDNYSSTMYSTEVHFAKKVHFATASDDDLSGSNKKEINNNDDADNHCGERVMHLISKCFPNSPSRQDMLISMNSTYKELKFYTVFVPELLKLQKDLQLNEIIKPAFPHVVAGHAVNFDEEKAEPEKVYKPFDNYIMMVDLRKTYGFRLYDRLKSFDRAHASIIMIAMAKNHALSWIYKQKNDISDIKTKFPFIVNDFSDKYFKTLFTDVLVRNGAMSYEILKSALGESSPALQGTKKILDQIPEILDISYGIGHSFQEFEKFIKVPPMDKSEENNNGAPWKVVVQGDCWTNNMMFRYNEVTGEPEEVIFVDLQIVREACPINDLAYMFYTSTDYKFRKEHLDDMLDLYAETFIHCCHLLKVEPLPEFCSKELKRRFHLSKVFGFMFSLGLLAIMLIENEIDAKDVEDVEEGKTVVDMIVALATSHAANHQDSILRERLVDVVQDMLDNGII